jgi:hypothetical protein
MPPTINQPPGPPGQPGPAPDMSRILSGMAEMNSNFSGIGNLTNVMRDMNNRQSAMESRLTQQYGLQNDFNNEQAHFNNQARNFFNSGQSQYAPPPPNYYFGGSNSSAATSATNTYTPAIPIPPNTPNPFQFSQRESAVQLDQLQLGDEFENANLLFPDMRQPDYSIPRYISMPEAPDYNEPLQLTNGDEEEEEAAAIPTANSDAENIVEQFMPQTNILESAKQDDKKRLQDLQYQDSLRIAKEQKQQDILLKERIAIEKQQALEDKQIKDQESAAKFQKQRDEVNSKRDKEYNTFTQTEHNLMKQYNNLADFTTDYDIFLMTVGPEYETEHKFLAPTERKIYNKLMKGVDNDSLKGNAPRIGSLKALENIQNNTMLQNFIKKTETIDYTPPKKANQKSDSMVAMLERDKSGASGVAAPSTNELRFG